MDRDVSRAGRYVALLRGINVGVAKRISMADLRAVFESLGYTGARTLLQSGNVVFDDPSGAGVSAGRLEDAIADATGVRASTLVLTAERFVAVLAENPFADCADPSRMIITFCDTSPVAPETENVTSPRSAVHHRDRPRPSDEELEPEKIVIGSDAIYQWLPDGVLETKLPARYTERFASVCTARNLRTSGKILALVNT